MLGAGRTLRSWKLEAGSQEPSVRLEAGNSASGGEFRFSSFMLFSHPQTESHPRHGKLPNFDLNSVFLRRLDCKDTKKDVRKIRSKPECV